MNSTALNSKGVESYNAKKYEEAIDYYNKAIETDPTNSAPYQNKGVALNALKKHQEALTALNKAVALNAENALYHTNRALTFKHLGQEENAVMDFTKAQSLLDIKRISDNMSQGNISFAKNTLSSIKLRTDVSVVMVGRTGAGKSTFINHFSGLPNLAQESSEQMSCTYDCKPYIVPVTGQFVRLVDTPGFADNREENAMDDDEILLKITQMIQSLDGGFKVGLYCLNAANTRFDAHDQAELELLKGLFSDDIVSHIVVVLTYLNNLNSDSIQQAKARWNKEQLKKVLGDDCPAICVYFNSNDKESLVGVRKQILEFAATVPNLEPEVMEELKKQNVNYNLTKDDAAKILAKTDGGRRVMRKMIETNQAELNKLKPLPKNDEKRARLTQKIQHLENLLK